MRSCGLEGIDAVYQLLVYEDERPMADAMMDDVELILKRHEEGTRLLVPRREDMKDPTLAALRKAVERTIARVTDLLG